MRDSPFMNRQAGPLKKLFTFVGGLIVLALGLMFSAVVLVTLVVAGLVIWGWLWWKTRELRRLMREAQARAPAAPQDGDIIEGEAVVVEEYRATDHRVLPADTNELR